MQRRLIERRAECRANRARSTGRPFGEADDRLMLEVNSLLALFLGLPLLTDRR